MKATKAEVAAEDESAGVGIAFVQNGNEVRATLTSAKSRAAGWKIIFAGD